MRSLGRADRCASHPWRHRSDVAEPAGFHNYPYATDDYNSNLVMSHLGKLACGERQYPSANRCPPPWRSHASRARSISRLLLSDPHGRPWISGCAPTTALPPCTERRRWFLPHHLDRRRFRARSDRLRNPVRPRFPREQRGCLEIEIFRSFPQSEGRGRRPTNASKCSIKQDGLNGHKHPLNARARFSTSCEVSRQTCSTTGPLSTSAFRCTRPRGRVAKGLLVQRCKPAARRRLDAASGEALVKYQGS